MEFISIEGTNGQLKLWKNSFSSQELSTYFPSITDEITLQQGQIKFFGKWYQKPRLEAFFHVSGKSYNYSNGNLKGHDFPPILNQLKLHVEALVGQKFNSALVNLYRDGNDSNGWHADNEKELGPNPTIASVSFGTTRLFVLKHNKTKETIRIPLSDGDILWMGPNIQVEWKHCIPKQRRVKEPRINITFRKLME